MRRLIRLLAAASLLGGLLVAVPAQPASATARCTTATHSHWSSSHGHYHTWYWQSTHRRSDGRLVFTAYMPQHAQWDTAVC